MTTPHGRLRQRASRAIRCAIGSIGVLLTQLGLAPTASAWDAWPCEVALCLANPAGPLAVAECVGPIKRAWKAWARGKGIPACIGVDAKGIETGPVTATTIDNTVATPRSPRECPGDFVYYAGKERSKHCALSGVTDQYIDGVLWGRLWYGGPDGRYYIEYLHEDPKSPRPRDTLPEDWARQKADIQAKADIAAAAWAAAKAAEASARRAEAEAREARGAADSAAAYVASWDAALPGLIAAAAAAVSDARKVVDDLIPKVAAAEVAAKAPGAKPDAVALYERLLGELMVAHRGLERASEVDRYYRDVLASMPAMRAYAERLAAAAAAREAIAGARRAEAAAAHETMLAADRAAAPLPPYAG